MPIETEKTGPRDASPAPSERAFQRVVSMSTSPGAEFVSGGGVPVIFGFLAFALTGLVYLVMLTLWRVFSFPYWVTIAVPLAAMLAYLLSLSRLTSIPAAKEWAAQFGFARDTDTRYRVRVVIPPRRAGTRLRRWAQRIAEIPEEAPPDESDLTYAHGGFEPVVARVWFAVRRSARVRGAALLMTAAVIAAMLVFWWVVLGGVNLIVAPGASMFVMATFALAYVVGAYATELLWPTYIRVAPGRLDVFDYPLLAHKRPTLTTYRLASHGLCVHFGRHAAAIEPPRPFEGEAEPALTNAKSWPYPRVHTPDRRPEYLSLTLTPGRREILCRLVQAALYQGEPEPLPEDRLLG